MPALRNIRRECVHGEDVVLADFTAPDGRVGSVGVPLREFDAHGEAILQQEANAAASWARVHRYEPPERDRFRELG